MEITETYNVKTLGDLAAKCWSGAVRVLEIPNDRYERGEISFEKKLEISAKAFDLIENMLCATLEKIDMTALNDFISFDFLECMKEVNPKLYEDFTGEKD